MKSIEQNDPHEYADRVRLLRFCVGAPLAFKVKFLETGIMDGRLWPLRVPFRLNDDEETTG